MTEIRFNTLPKELISSIAISSDPLSILRLSQTCRTIRFACYDSLVFREVIQRQQRRWDSESLDLDAIEHRCGKNANLWARYALADQKTWELSRKECPLETPANFLHWLPELFVVKHPFMLEQCWGRFLWDPYLLTARQMFCFAMGELMHYAILAQPNALMEQLEKSLAMHEDDYLRKDESSKAYLWGLFYMMLKVRKLFGTRRAAAWPYNHAAVPYLSLPAPRELDMGPTNSSYALPLPFAEGDEVSLDWDGWYLRHSREMTKSYLLEGTWRGYYTHFPYFRPYFSALDQLDPPMMDIEFVRRQTQDGDSDEDFEVVAADCVDGIGPFRVVGRISQVDDVFTLCGYKAYDDDWITATGAAVTWNWKLKLAPFGLVGYWGVAQEDGVLERSGCVWLWKTPA